MAPYLKFLLMGLIAILTVSFTVGYLKQTLFPEPETPDLREGCERLYPDGPPRQNPDGSEMCYLGGVK